MERQVLDDQFLKELFDNKSLTLKYYLSILNKRGLYTMYSHKDLLAKLKIDLKDDLPTYFEKTFINDSDKGMIPVINHRDKRVQRRILLQFVEEYTQRVVLVQKTQKEKEIRKKQKAKSDDQAYLRDKQPEKRPMSTQQKQKLQVNVFKRAPKQAKKKDDKADEQRQDDFFDQIPQAYEDNNQETKYINTLLTLDLTQQFQQEFQDVKDLIISQLKCASRVRDVYCSFLTEFVIYNYITCGRCDGDLFESSEEIITSLHKIQAKNDLDEADMHFLRQIWTSLCKNLKILLQSDQRLKIDEITQSLVEGVNDSYLTFTMLRQPYGNTLDGTILINLNQWSSQKKIDLNSFKNSVMKSYIALILYHELAHSFIRRCGQVKLDISRGSFGQAVSTVGAIFLRTIKARIKMMPQWITITVSEQHFQEHNKQEISQEFLSFQAQIRKFLDKFSDMIAVFQIKKDQFDELKEEINILSRPYSRHIMIESLMKMKPEDWQTVLSYILQLESSAKIIQNEENFLYEERQTQYRFFFSLMVTQDIAKKTIMKKLGFSSQKYHIYENILKNRAKNQGKFFIYPLETIEQFCKTHLSMKTGLLDQNSLSRYSEHILLKGFNTITLDDMVKIFVQNFDLNRIEIFSTRLGKLCGKFEWIVKFKKVNQSTIEAAINRLPKDISQKQALKDIFEAEQIYLRIQQFLKYFDLLWIIVNLPSFFHNQSNNIGSKRLFQSGFDIQKRIFGRIDMKYIYGSDFQLMKNIDKNWRQVGIQPEALKEKDNRIGIERNQKRSCQPTIAVSQIGCGVYHRNMAMAEQRDNLIALEKMKKKEEAMTMKEQEVAENETDKAEN